MIKLLKKMRMLFFDVSIEKQGKQGKWIGGARCCS